MPGPVRGEPGVLRGLSATPASVEDQPLKFGIMCRGTSFPAWQARAVEELLKLPGVDAGLLILGSRPSGEDRARRFIGRRDKLWTLYNRTYVAKRSRAARRVDMSDTLEGIPAIECSVREEGYSEYFSDEDVERIQGYDLDFILRFGFGIIRGEILEAARYGVWSFHHDDEQKYRGSPPCFHEIRTGDPVTGSILQRLTERLDGGIVLQKGWFRTIDHSYVRNRDEAYFGSAGWPARVCREMRSGAATYLEDEPTSSEARIFRNPGNVRTAMFLAKLAKNFVRSQLRGLFRADTWGVGIARMPIEVFLEEMPAIDWLPGPGGTRYVADPFGIQKGEETAILVEDFDYTTRRGTISVFEPPVTRPVLPMEVHASYPYTFEHAGEIYCVPEIEKSRRVVLFRAVRFPGEWEEAAVLLEDVPALDPTVFRHGGRWWLFCAEPDPAQNARLFAWHAADLAGPYQEHAANPLKVDIRSTRPAGTPFLHKGVLYRPAQDRSRTYGGAVAINRVETLTPDEFREEVVRVVGPDPLGPFPDGLHTISSVGAVTLVDGKRSGFIAPGFRHELGSRARKLFRS
ncbi:MAG: hypothetical protein WD276_08565 [Actinomycetota bacterium]